MVNQLFLNLLILGCQKINHEYVNMPFQDVLLEVAPSALTTVDDSGDQLQGMKANVT